MNTDPERVFESPLVTISMTGYADLPDELKGEVDQIWNEAVERISKALDKV